jgi:hypothetical protein
MNTQNAQNNQHPNVTPAAPSLSQQGRGLGEGLAAPDARTAPPQPAPPQPIDPATEWRVEFVRRKQRADAFFHQLTPDQQRTICDWFGKLSVPEIQQRIAAAAPDGWGLQISQTVLRRTRALYYASTANAATEEMLDAVTDMQPFTRLTNFVGIQDAIALFLHQEAVHIAQRDPKSESLKDILANIQKLSALEFKRQQLEFQREKLRRSRAH